LSAIDRALLLVCPICFSSPLITFSTPTIEGTVLRRNKADTRGKHPWKAEVTEGETGVTASTITNWYSAVYEPTYPTNSQSGGSGSGN